MRKDFPQCSFTCGITNLSLLTADERAGMAFVLALVAASKPGSDMLKKAARRIQQARKKGQTVNAEIDENGNTFADGTDDDDGSAEIIYAYIFVSLKHIANVGDVIGISCLVQKRSSFFH